MNKSLKVMTSAALLAGVVAPVAVTTVDAASDNFVDKVVYVKKNYKTGDTADNNFHIEPKKLDLTTDNTFRLSLPSGAKWLTETYTGTGTAGDFTVVSVTDQDLELRPTAKVNKATVADVPLFFKIDGAEGEVKVTLDPRGSHLTGGQYTIAVVASGATTASISSVKTIGSGETKIGDIRIDETAIAALDADEEIKLTLPANFKWVDDEASVVAAGGFTASDINGISVNTTGRTLTVKLAGVSDKAPGTIYLKGLKIKPSRDAKYGDVVVDITGKKAASQELTVAKYADYGTTVEIGDVPTLLAGRDNADEDDLKLAKLTLKETIEGSWITNRNVVIEFPKWVKVVGVKASDVDGFAGGLNDADVGAYLSQSVEGDSNVFEFDVPGADAGKKRELTIEFYVSVQADASGDITANVSGKAGIEGELVLGKAISPVTVETTPADVKTGVKNQKLNDIVITEATKGAFLEGKEVVLSLGDGVKFSGEPTVTVEEGNLEIKDVDIDDDGQLTFVIKSESTKASKIVISDIEVDLDRTIPEGKVNLSVGGPALVQNDEDEGVAFKNTDIGHTDWSSKDADDFKTLDLGEFEKAYVVKLPVATVVTPAEGNVTAKEVVLKIGQSTMTVGGEEVALDAAPFIEASTGRTYLPLRAIANAVGANSVEWDNATRTATVIKGGLVAQMTIGENYYVLNGAKIAMDGKAQIVSDRTFLPIRALGNALGADVQWDAATQTVTIK